MAKFYHDEQFRPFFQFRFFSNKHLKGNQRTSWLRIVHIYCFQQFWLSWLCFDYDSFVLILDIYFFCRKFEKNKFLVTSVIVTYTKMCKLWLHQALIVLFLTSKWDKFQTQTKFSLGKKPFLSTLCCTSQNFHKKINFLSLKSSYHRLAHKKKSTLQQKKLQNLKDKLIGTVCT